MLSNKSKSTKSNVYKFRAQLTLAIISHLKRSQWSRFYDVRHFTLFWSSIALLLSVGLLISVFTYHPHIWFLINQICEGFLLLCACLRLLKSISWWCVSAGFWPICPWGLCDGRLHPDVRHWSLSLKPTTSCVCLIAWYHWTISNSGLWI